MSSKVHSDSQAGATINTVANYFHAQISTTDDSERAELLSTIKQQRNQAQESLAVLPSIFMNEEVAAGRFPAMKESFRSSDDDFGAPKGRREAETKIAATTEVAQVTEIAGGSSIKQMPEFDLIRL